MNDQKETVIISKEEHYYYSHPCAVKLEDGTIVVVFNKSTHTKHLLHPPDYPDFRNVVIRSCDNGRTWTIPQVFPDYSWNSLECPGIMVTKTGIVIVNQYRYDWYPLDLARRLYNEKGIDFLLAIEDRDFSKTPARTDKEWEDALYPWAKAVKSKGSYIQISDDNAKTFTNTIKLNLCPYMDGYSKYGGTQRSDGVILLALQTLEPEKGSTFVISSVDDGKSWSSPVTVVCEPQIGASEPSILCLENGKIIIVTRTNTGFVYQCDSNDGGVTWGEYKKTPMFGGPAHLLLLKDGRILCTYGRRKSPYGIRACVSMDDGETWDHMNEIIIRDDMLNGNLGYPSTVELDEGRLLSVYYGETPDRITCIQGTFFNL